MPPTPDTLPPGDELPTFNEVLAAAGRIRGIAVRTPVLTSATLDAAFGARLHFKAETLQRGGAFKFRGAYNALSRLTPEQRLRGVASYSSGNHAQAVALAAKLLGMPAVIVMPEDAPAMKVAATRAHGARVVFYDRYREDRASICQALADSQGMTVIPPFDHPDVIAGQGTAALELLEEAGNLDALFVPLGGGGLLSGTLLATGDRSPECKVYGVEPDAGNDGQQSLRAGRIVRIQTPGTIADGAQTQQLGQRTFPIIRRSVADILTVSDAALVESMRVLAEYLQISVEPTGCLGFAAAISMRESLKGQRVGVMLSGGNVDAAQFAALAANFQRTPGG